MLVPIKKPVVLYMYCILCECVRDVPRKQLGGRDTSGIVGEGEPTETVDTSGIVGEGAPTESADASGIRGEITFLLVNNYSCTIVFMDNNTICYSFNSKIKTK